MKTRTTKTKSVKGNDVKCNGGHQIGRREFLKKGTAGALVAGITTVSASKQALAENAAKKLAQQTVTTHDDFPNPIRFDYKPPRSWDNAFGSGFFHMAMRAAGRFVDEELARAGDEYLTAYNNYYDNSKLGESQLAKATVAATWSITNAIAGPSAGAVAGYGVLNWDQPTAEPPHLPMSQDFLAKDKYKFISKKEAADAIKRVARLCGADVVGITRRDKRWDYREFFNPVPPLMRKMFPSPPTPETIPQMVEMMKTWGPDQFFHGWEQYPFEPKTVVVLGFGMDYESLATSPSMIGEASAGAEYSRMAETAYQMSVFFKQLGYRSTAAGNDTGLSVPYAIAAGLGEGSRIGAAINYKLGPAMRLAKVYTEFDFVDYDKPKTFGVMDFCKNCKRCAEACPSKAISFDRDPTFEPTHENKDNAFYNAKGVYKWYSDCKKCFQFWGTNKGACANCLTACPYNKPDVWHHRAVRSMGKIDIGPLHAFLREMDKIFGYGNTFDEKAVHRFFENRNSRAYNGGL